jgi:hypothetical protein
MKWLNRSWIAVIFLILENVRKYSCAPTIQNICNNEIKLIINYVSCVLYSTDEYLAKDYKGEQYEIQNY